MSSAEKPDAMHLIPIKTTDTTTIHCPLCGALSLSAEGTITACAHLVYVSSSETLDDPWHDPKGVGGSENDLVSFLDDALAPSAFAFQLYAPAPSGMEVLVAYEP